MMKRPFYFVIALVLVGMLSLILSHLLPTTSETMRELFLQPGKVRGMAIESNGKLFSLNFAQQEVAIQALNRSVPVQDGEEQKLFTFPYSELIIYQFNQPDIRIKPVAYIEPNLPRPPLHERHDRNIVYSCPQWNPQGFLIELSG
ncbi:MAG: hypothetical protein KDK65_07585, partial [Chlamydiia bacterium]|nr:hypothetical protein [Chlamydiia bacterium]